MNVNNIAYWIPKEQMKLGMRYRCRARNFTIGTWNGKGFEYVREKFGHRFKDIEYHWDDGAPYGTCKPLEEIRDDF